MSSRSWLCKIVRKEGGSAGKDGKEGFRSEFPPCHLEAITFSISTWNSYLYLHCGAYVKQSSKTSKSIWSSNRTKRAPAQTVCLVWINLKLHTANKAHSILRRPLWAIGKFIALLVMESIAARKDLQRTKYMNLCWQAYHSPSKLSKEDIKQIQETTHFEKKEIQQWYKGIKPIEIKSVGWQVVGFLKDCPSGKLSEGGFQNIYHQFFPNGDSAEFASRVFHVFDMDGSGEIDFKEFICALSITSRGTVEDKLDWAFQLYDLDKDGRISYNEMLQIVQALYKMASSIALHQFKLT